ncbi:non-heme chloroperoxidase [Streptomyces albogriseolus]|uniref:Non-heme chloroperoxidase n=1 Tax=Streptomyces albogriseolus TaxID=1887 RepID=A0ACC6UEQ4_STRAO
MPLVTTGEGVEIFCRDWSSGRPVMFRHGWPLSSDRWDAQLLFLVRRGYRVVAHDRRGGRALRPGRPRPRHGRLRGERPPQWPRGRVVARVAQRSPGTSPGTVAAGLPGPSSSQRSRRVATDRFRFDRPCVDVSRSVIRNGWCQGVAGSAPAHHEGIRAFAETDFTGDLLAS